MKQLNDDVYRSYVDWLWSIRVRLVELHLEQRQLAASIGVDPSNLSKYLTGVIEPGLSFYFIVEDFFNDFRAL